MAAEPGFQRQHLHQPNGRPDQVPRENLRSVHVESQCVLWVHDENYSKEDILFNASHFPSVSPGVLLKVLTSTPYPSTRVKDFGSTIRPDQDAISDYGDDRLVFDTYQSSSERPSDETDRSHGTERGRVFVFEASDVGDDERPKYPGLQLSVCTKIATLFGFSNRMSVSLASADRSVYEASHCEITFRDLYLSRADIRMATPSIPKVLYCGQEIVLLGSIKTIVKSVFLGGRKALCGCFTDATKPTFRSESSRFVLYIQMSSEMWTFDSDGEIMFSKVVDRFLPDLFRRWSTARHLVSIVLFSRIENSLGGELDETEQQADTQELPGRTRKSYQDYYRVVVTEMINTDSRKILYQLKKEFKNFLRDTCTSRQVLESSVQASIDDAKSELPLITGYPSPARTGNVLEAINVAFLQFPREYIDQDLIRTGVSVVIITPGTGAFEVDDESLLRLTTDNLVNSGVAVDLVCLSSPPLHSVPLFKYRHRIVHTNQPRPMTSESNDSTSHEDGNAKLHADSTASDNFGNVDRENTKDDDFVWNMALPHWCNISFYTDSIRANMRNSRHRHNYNVKDNQWDAIDFIPRCRMYEIQTSGLMEDEMSNISIPYLAHLRNLAQKGNPYSRQLEDGTSPSEVQPKADRRNSKHTSERVREARFMDSYDEHLFDGLLNPLLESDNTVLHPLGHNAMSAAASNVSSRPATALLHNDLYTAHEKTLTHKPSKPSFIERASKSSKVDIKPSRTHSKHDDDDTRSIISIKKASGVPPHLLLGSIGKSSLAKAVASTGISQVADMATTSSTSRIGQTDQNSGPEAAFSISRQIKSSLFRQASSTSTTQQSQQQSGRGSIQRAASIMSANSDQDPGKTVDNQLPAGRTANIPTRINSQEELNTLRTDRSRYTSRRESVPISLSKPKIESYQSPWLSVINPSNPQSERSKLSSISRFDTWSRFLPRSRQSSTMKWTSICMPAVLPLTNEASVAMEESQDMFEENVHKVAAHDEQLSDIPIARATLIAKIVNFRLARGFQVMIRSSKIQEHGLPGNLNFLDEKYLSVDGVSLCMSKGNTIHYIIASGNEVQIVRKQRKTSSLLTTPGEYKPFIRTALSTSYKMHTFAFSLATDNLNWTLADNFIAGYSDGTSNASHVGRARFVFIPVEPNRRALPGLHEDTEDDIRVEGIQKLTQIWERSRVINADARRVHVRANAPKDPNPLGLEFQTRDPSAVVAAGLDLSLLSEGEHILNSTNLFSGNEQFRTSNIDMSRLAQELQGERGVKIMDRRWHLRFHAECFIGFELVSWLTENFKDIATREAAVELGQQLMDQGLFFHVIKRQVFRDANYFYRIAEKYKKSRTEGRGSWFSRKHTPSSTPPNDSDDNPPERPRTRAGVQPTDPPSYVSSPQPSKKLQVKLSSALYYDADLRRKSYRSEIITLHYDRLYNPFSCYSVRIEFFSVTAKLVDDAISNWAQTAERFGLRMVQVPISEMSIIGEMNQFRTPHRIKLAIRPPDTPIHQSHYFDSQSLPTRPANELHSHQKALLRRFSYVLDRESSSSFPTDVELTYSWGTGVYKYTQFIHKTGQLLVQVDQNGDFLLFTNQLYSTRHISAKEASKLESMNNDRRPLSTVQAADKFSPLSSPRLRAAEILSSPMTVPFTDTQRLLGYTPEQLRDELEAFCNSRSALTEFFDELTKPSHEEKTTGGGSSISGTSTPHLDPTIPKLGLPPSLGIDEILTASPSHVVTGGRPATTGATLKDL